MPRVKRGRVHQRKRARMRAKVKGYLWGRKSKVKLAKVAILKAGAYAFRDRRARKRNFRELWIVRLNAALRAHGTPYREFVHAAKRAGVILDRKVLADLAVNHPHVFEAIVQAVKK